MKKVLMLSTFIPHYREGLMQLMSKKCNLTVTSVDLETLNLIAPNKVEKNYKLINTKVISIINKILRINIIPKEVSLANAQDWDVIFCFYSLRYPHRFLIFIINRYILRRKNKWVWVGHIYGKNKSFFAKWIMRFFLNKSDGVITYTNEYANMLKDDGITVNVDSWNNTSVFSKDIQPLKVDEDKINTLNLVFVGRYQERKRLDILLKLAKRRADIKIRLIGPKMNTLTSEVLKQGLNEKISIYGPLTGEKLKEHFKWGHVIVNPGALGLLVVTAGQYGRPIVTDNQTVHGPEYIIAKQSNQFFINWNNEEEVDLTLDKFKNNPELIKEMGLELSSLILKEYTFEKSIKAFEVYLD